MSKGKFSGGTPMSMKRRRPKRADQLDRTWGGPITVTKANGTTVVIPADNRRHGESRVTRPAADPPEADALSCPPTTSWAAQAPRP